LHNTKKSLIRRIDKSKSNVLWNSKLLIGVYGGHIGKIGFWELDARVEVILSTKRRLAKDWERPTKRATTVIIMHSDKTSLKEA
jgi:hypothetical protein